MRFLMESWRLRFVTAVVMVLERNLPTEVEIWIAYQEKICYECKVYKSKNEICEWAETPCVTSNCDYHTQ